MLNFIAPKSKRNKNPKLAGISAFISLLVLASVATAGSLTPPGAVSSTMHSLAEIWNSIASNSYDSTAVTANANGSLIQHLKYIEANMTGGKSVTSNSLDFDELVGSMNLDEDTTIASNGFTLSIMSNVGIGTTTPQARLHVAGGIEEALRLTNDDESVYALMINNLTYGNDDSTGFGFSQDNIGAGHVDLAGQSIMYIPAGDHQVISSRFHSYLVNAASGEGSTTAQSIITDTSLSGSNIAALDASAVFQATSGTMDRMTAGSIIAVTNNASAGTINDLIGVSGGVQALGAVDITNAYGGIFGVLSSGSTSITNAYGVQIFNAQIAGAGTIDNNYGLYISNQAGLGTTLNYNLYSEGSGLNYFGGNTGIGTNDPQKKLDVAGGAGGALRLSTDDAGSYGLTINNLTFGNDDTTGFTFQQADDGGGGIGVNGHGVIAIPFDGRQVIAPRFHAFLVNPINNEHGITGQVIVDNTASSSLSIVAVGGFAGVEAPSGTVDQAISGEFVTETSLLTLGGSLTEGIGVRGRVQGFGAASIGNAYAGIFGTVAGGTTAITNSYGVTVESARLEAAGTIENNYGLYIRNQDGLGTTLNYNIYSEGNGLNYFGGTIIANGGCVGCGGGSVASNSLDFDEFVDNMTLDADTAIANNGFSLTIQNASISNQLELTGTTTAPLLTMNNSAPGSSTGIQADIGVDGAAAYALGASIYVHDTAGPADNSALFGQSLFVDSFATGTNTNVYSLDAGAEYLGAGTANVLEGIRVTTNNGAGTVNTLRGVEINADNGGSIINAYGIDMTGLNGTVTNNYGMRIRTSSGTIENGYGLYIDSVAGTSVSYDIYAAGPATTNYFAGRVGIGTNNPVEQLEVLSASSGIRVTNQGGATNGYTQVSGGTITLEQDPYGGTPNIGPYMDFENSAGEGDWRIADIFGDGGGGQWDGGISIESSTSLGSIVYLSPSGNVGIGQNEDHRIIPTAKLDVRGDFAGDTEAIFRVGSVSESFRVQENGNVGIGTLNVDTKFEVAGIASVSTLFTDLTGTVSTFAVCHPDNGQTTGQELVDCDTPVGDYMELYPMDMSAQEGDIVMADATRFVTSTEHDRVPVLVKATDRAQTLGIVSVAAKAGDFNSVGHNIAKSDNPLPLALNGRVKVKVNMQNGPVAVGDPIALSSIPGVGAKAISAGLIVGTALEPATQDGMVMVYVRPTYWAPMVPADSGTAGSQIANNGDESSLFARVLDFLGGLVLRVRGLVVSDQVCIGSTCINEEQLKSLMEKNAITTSSPTPTATPTLDTPTPTPLVSEEPTPTPAISPEATIEPTPEVSVSPEATPAQ